MNAKDWTLVVLSATNGRALSPVQLQKALFLVGQQVRGGELGDGFYRFSPYDYGPFCSEVYADAEVLETEGLASITRAIPRSYREYSATPEGVRNAQTLRKGLSEETGRYIDRLIEWILPLSFDELVRAIYKKYPETKAKSVFKG